MKKIIAREWLIFLIAVLVGVILTDFLYFMGSYESIIYRKTLYNLITSNPPNQLPDWVKNVPWEFRAKYPMYIDMSDSALAAMLAKKYPDAYGDLPLKVEEFHDKIIEDSLVNSADISFSEFNNILNDKSKRKTFYNYASDYYDLDSYNLFESEISKPTFYAGLLKLFNQLFSEGDWLETLFSILLPFLILQFIRSIYFSIRLVRK